MDPDAKAVGDSRLVNGSRKLGEELDTARRGHTAAAPLPTPPRLRVKG